MGCVKSASLLFSVLSPCVLIGVAHGAQTPGDEAGDKAGDEAGDEAAGIAQDEDRAPAGEAKGDRVAKGGAKPESSPWVEEENQDYRFVGLRARMAYIPEWMFGGSSEPMAAREWLSPPSAPNTSRVGTGSRWTRG